MMDFMMPGMDGWEATRILCANPETKDIPIRATTAVELLNKIKTLID
jgi:CheY-like chemotaxis protein